MLLFAYGSLKEGFPNFRPGQGRRLPGHYRTAQPHPLYLADGTLPCLLRLPGHGHHVVGQLFEVNAAQLAALDGLERVGQPGGYLRETIEVLAVGDASAGASAGASAIAVAGAGAGTGTRAKASAGAAAGVAEDAGAATLLTAFVYLQPQARLASGGPHVGPLAQYTLEHAQSLRW